MHVSCTARGTLNHKKTLKYYGIFLYSEPPRERMIGFIRPAIGSLRRTRGSIASARRCVRECSGAVQRGVHRYVTVAVTYHYHDHCLVNVRTEPQHPTVRRRSGPAQHVSAAEIRPTGPPQCTRSRRPSNVGADFSDRSNPATTPTTIIIITNNSRTKTPLAVVVSVLLLLLLSSGEISSPIVRRRVRLRGRFLIFRTGPAFNLRRPLAVAEEELKIFVPGSRRFTNDKKKKTLRERYVKFARAIELLLCEFFGSYFFVPLRRITIHGFSVSIMQ